MKFIWSVHHPKYLILSAFDCTVNRQFRECLGNDLETLLEKSNEGTINDEDGHGTGGEPVKKKPQQQKSAKKHQLAPPPGSRPITNFFKA